MQSHDGSIIRMYIIRSPNVCYVQSIDRTGIYTVTSEHLGGWWEKYGTRRMIYVKHKS
jgi:competence transcription factor ComK